ncbi:MAG: glycosyltransferase family 4 protein [Candidatus Altiarchaeota archaeon]
MMAEKQIIFISPFSSAAPSSIRMVELSKSLDDPILIFPAKDRYGESRIRGALTIGYSKRNPLSYLLCAYNQIVAFKPKIVYFLKPNPYSFLPALAYKLRWGGKLIFDCDEWDPLTLKDNKAHWIKVFVSRILSVLAIRYSDKIIVSNKNILKLLPIEKRKNCEYIPNGVDTEKFKRNPKKSPAEFTVMYVGSLYKEEQVKPIMDAIPYLRSKIPSFKLVFVGPGNTSSLKKKANSKHVHFTGELTHEMIPEVLSEADVVLAVFAHLPSLIYASNIKVFEYMAAEIPIIASNTGEISEILAHGDAGYILDFQSPHKIAEYIKSIHDHPDIAENKASKARKLAEERYDWRILSEKLRKSAEELLEGPRPHIAELD